MSLAPNWKKIRNDNPEYFIAKDSWRLTREGMTNLCKCYEPYNINFDDSINFLFGSKIKYLEMLTKVAQYPYYYSKKCLILFDDGGDRLWLTISGNDVISWLETHAE